MDPEEIKQDLLNKNVSVKSVSKLIAKNGKSYSFLITAEKGATIRDLKREMYST